MPDLAGKTIGKYRVIERIGRGGMADVYKGYQSGLDRFIAIKVLHGFLSDDGDFVGRFQREARAIAALRHPNVVQVFDFDRHEDQYYMVMEYIDGPSLKARLQEIQSSGQKLSDGETLGIFKGLGAAIDYAHAHGVIHRDIKPANVMFNSEGEVVLTDFGIAHMVGGSRYTTTGSVAGTPTYMAPEQGRGLPGDERSDIYSLGVILFEAVTGQVPYDGDTPFSVIMKHVNDPLPRPSRIANVRPAVEKVVLKALEKDPALRYQTAGDLARSLEIALVSHESTVVERARGRGSDRPGDMTQIATAETGRRSKWGLAAVGLLAVILLAALWLIVLGRPAPSSSVAARSTAGSVPGTVEGESTSAASERGTAVAVPDPSTAVVATPIPGVDSVATPALTAAPTLIATSVQAASATATPQPAFEPPTATDTPARTATPAASQTNTGVPSPTATKIATPSTHTPLPTATPRPTRTATVPPTDTSHAVADCDRDGSADPDTHCVADRYPHTAADCDRDAPANPDTHCVADRYPHTAAHCDRDELLP